MLNQKHLLIFLTILICVLNMQWYQQNNPHFINDGQLKQMLKNDHSTVKIVKFFTPWCKYCRYMKAFFDGFRQKHQVDEHLKIYQFNCMDANMRICAYNYHVSGFPAIIVYSGNGSEITRMAGMYPEDVVFNFLADINRQAINLGKSLQQTQQAPKIQQKTPSSESKATQNIKQPNKQIKQSQQQNVQKPQQTKQQQPQQIRQQKQIQNPQPQKIQLQDNNQQLILVNNSQKTPQSSFYIYIKYASYLVGALIGGYYAYHVMSAKYGNQNRQHKKATQPKYQAMSEEIEPQRNSYSNDNENKKLNEDKNEKEMVIEDIQDQNL